MRYASGIAIFSRHKADIIAGAWAFADKCHHDIAIAINKWSPVSALFYDAHGQNAGHAERGDNHYQAIIMQFQVATHDAIFSADTHTA